MVETELLLSVLGVVVKILIGLCFLGGLGLFLILLGRWDTLLKEKTNIGLFEWVLVMLCIITLGYCSYLIGGELINWLVN